MYCILFHSRGCSLSEILTHNVSVNDKTVERFIQNFTENVTVINRIEYNRVFFIQYKYDLHPKQSRDRWGIPLNKA